MQVNQGEVEYYKNQGISAILPCHWVGHWEIIISSLPWVSSERIRGPASGNHLHTIQSMIVPSCQCHFWSWFAPISIYFPYIKGGEIFPLIWLWSAHCSVSDIHASWWRWCCFIFFTFLFSLKHLSLAGKVWEGPRCRLSQGWQLGALLTCSLIKSSWARVHLWQGLCQAADRWEAVLNTNVALSGDRQEMPPCCANNSCNSIPNI